MTTLTQTHRTTEAGSAWRQAEADNRRYEGLPRDTSAERKRAIDLRCARTAVANTQRDLETAHLKAERFKTKPERMSDGQYRQVARDADLQLKWAQEAHHFAQRRLAEVKAAVPLAAE